MLLHALAEGPLEMAPLLTSAFLHIIDSPQTRAYLNPGTDLEVSTCFAGSGPSYELSIADRSHCLALQTPMGREWSTRSESRDVRE